MKLNVKRNSLQVSAQKKAVNIVSETVGNYEKHPFFIKKANAAKALLKLIGLPKSLAIKSGK